GAREEAGGHRAAARLRAGRGQRDPGHAAGTGRHRARRRCGSPARLAPAGVGRGTAGGAVSAAAPSPEAKRPARYLRRAGELRLCLRAFARTGLAFARVFARADDLLARALDFVLALAFARVVDADLRAAAPDFDFAVVRGFDFALALALALALGLALALALVLVLVLVFALALRAAEPDFDLAFAFD